MVMLEIFLQKMAPFDTENNFNMTWEIDTTEKIYKRNYIMLPKKQIKLFLATDPTEKEKQLLGT